MDREDEDKLNKEILAEIGRVSKLFDGTAARVADIEKGLALAGNPNIPRGMGGHGLDIGSLVIKSDAFKAAFDGYNPQSADRSFAGRMAKIDVGSILKAITTNATAIPDKTRLAGIVQDEPNWTNFLFRRFAQAQMTGGVLEYVQDTTPAWDSTVPPQTEGQPKPEVTSTFALKQATPRTIAHWLSASKQILADASALGGYLNNQLLQGLMLKLEYQVIMGPGTGTHMTGVYTTATAHGAPEATDTPLDTIRKAIAAVEANGWFVDTIGLHPIDWANIQTLRGEDGHYLYGSPSRSGTGASPMWGKVVVPSFIIPQGNYLVGPFQTAAQLFEREAANVQVGFQNDDFTRNLVTTLAETRAVLANYTPAAFRKGALQ